MRLIEHRRRREADADRGPLLTFEELDRDEREAINSDFLARVRMLGAEGEAALYRIFVDTLHSWGVMCTHPQSFRLYDGNRNSYAPLDFEQSRWYSCLVCGCSVINR